MDSLSLLVLESFSLTSLSLSLLEGSLGSEGIDLSLLISSLLLLVSKLLSFSLLLILDSLGLQLSLVLLLVLGFLIGNDFLLLVLLLLGSLFFLDQRLGIGFSSLFHQGVDPISLSLSLGSILDLHPLDIAKEL